MPPGFLGIMGGKSKSIEKSQKSQKSQKKVEKCPDFIIIKLVVLKK